MIWVYHYFRKHPYKYIHVRPELHPPWFVKLSKTPAPSIIGPVVLGTFVMRKLCFDQVSLAALFLSSMRPCTATNLRDCETKRQGMDTNQEHTWTWGPLFLHIPPDHTRFQQGGIQGGIPLIEEWAISCWKQNLPRSLTVGKLQTITVEVIMLDELRNIETLIASYINIVTSTEDSNIGICNPSKDLS